MKNKSYQLLLLVFTSITLFTYCTPTTPEEKIDLEAEWKNIMDVHDEIMPKTMELPPIWEKLETLKTNIEEEKIKNTDKQIMELKAAHQAMYLWMEEANAIKAELDKKKDEALQNQLTAEMERIQKVKTDTDKAYDEGTAFLKQLEE